MSNACNLRSYKGKMTLKLQGVLVVRRLMECSLRWGYWLLKATPVLPLGSTRLLPGVSYPREIQES